METNQEAINRALRESSKRDPLLSERERTHGPFQITAYISQRLKGFFYNSKHRYSQERLSDVQMEALDMIAVKCARILAGDAKCKDHWDDIAGYAKLGGEACE